MIRLVGIIVGLVFTLAVLVSFGRGAYTVVTEGMGEQSAEYALHKDAREPAGGFQHAGVFGTWDIAQLQRGYQVYKEVCSACHGIRHVAFRNLSELTYTEAQVKAEAATWMVPGINPDTGESELRPGLPTDNFPSPYANNVAAAAANNNAIPPDLSLITKARKDGTNYVYSLLTGYVDPATYEVDGVPLAEAYPEFETGPGLHFNPYFANVNIAMAPTYRDRWAGDLCGRDGGDD